MNGRVILLLGAAVAFAQIWSAQGNGHHAHRARSVPVTRVSLPLTIPTAHKISDADSVTAETLDIASGELMLSCLADAPRYDEHQNREEPVVKTQVLDPPIDPLFSVTGLPLPAGIVPGNYYVTDNEARVQLVEVTPEQTTGNANSGEPSPDFYVKSLGKERWLYVPYRRKIAQAKQEAGISPREFLVAAENLTPVPEIANAGEAAETAPPGMFSAYSVGSGLLQWQAVYESLQTRFAQMVQTFWQTIAMAARSGLPNSWSHAMDKRTTPPEFSTATDDDQESSVQ